jgi:RimJ/RimL family protein N-acetyltransferase
VIETERLALRRLDLDDAAFILALVNDPDWLRHIGDKNVHSLDDARAYLANGPIGMYATHGFGLYAVERREDGALIGMCGLIKRDTLDDVDLGFAFLPPYRGLGYAREACVAVLARAAREFAFLRVAAITSPDNAPSIRLLGSLGFAFVRRMKLTPDDAGTNLYLRSLADLPG